MSDDKSKIIPFGNRTFATAGIQVVFRRDIALAPTLS